MDKRMKQTMLVAGYATGIGTIALFPRMWINYGLTGLLVHIVFLAILTVLAVAIARRVAISGELFAVHIKETLNKPGILLAFLTVGITFLSYYAANVGLTLLAPILGTGALGRLIAKIILFAIIAIVLLAIPGQSIELMARGSILFLTLVPITTAVYYLVLHPAQALYTQTLHDLFKLHPLTTDLIRDAALRAIYATGFGFGFYLLIGNLTDEEEAPKIISGGIILQLITGIIATFAIIQVLTTFNPNVIHTYLTGTDETAIQVFGLIPQAYGMGIVTILLALSLFFAGLTSILPVAEVGTQILNQAYNLDRNKAVITLLAASLTLGIIDAQPSIAQLLLQSVTLALFFTSIFEAYPLLESEEKPTPLIATLIVIAILMFTFNGLAQFKYFYNLGGYNTIAAITTMALILIAWFLEYLTPQEAETTA